MNIKIRKMLKEDLSFFNETRNLVRNYLHNNETFTLEQTNSWFEENREDFFIIENENNMIGYFRTSNNSIKNKSIMIGADIHPHFQGNGYAKVAYSQFLNLLFEEKGYNKVYLEVLSFNIRAKNLYEKLGFKTEGIKREEIFRDGQYLDSICMSILRREYYA